MHIEDSACTVFADFPDKGEASFGCILFHSFSVMLNNKKLLLITNPSILDTKDFALSLAKVH